MDPDRCSTLAGEDGAMFCSVSARGREASGGGGETGVGGETRRRERVWLGSEDEGYLPYCPRRSRRVLGVVLQRRRRLPCSASLAFAKDSKEDVGPTVGTGKGERLPLRALCFPSCTCTVCTPEHLHSRL